MSEQEKLTIWEKIWRYVSILLAFLVVRAAATRQEDLWLLLKFLGSLVLVTAIGFACVVLVLVVVMHLTEQNGRLSALGLRTLLAQYLLAATATLVFLWALDVNLRRPFTQLPKLVGIPAGITLITHYFRSFLSGRKAL